MKLEMMGEDQRLHAALERFKMILITKLDREAMDGNVDLSAMADFVSDMIVIRYRKDLYGKTVHTYTVEYPDGWWQALRERFFPEWWTNHWPIKYAQVKVDARQIMPDYKIPGHEDEKQVRIAVPQ